MSAHKTSAEKLRIMKADIQHLKHLAKQIGQGDNAHLIDEGAYTCGETDKCSGGKTPTAPLRLPLSLLLQSGKPSSC